MLALIKTAELKNSVGKFTPKKFYEIDPRLKTLAREKDSSFVCDEE